MHRLRSSIRAREAGAPARPLSLDERRREALPESDAPPEGERRKGDRREHERHRDVADKAAILYRGKRAMVAVSNLSNAGVTLEAGLVPGIGETMLVELPGMPPIDAEVRWVEAGRIGLSFD